MLFERFRMVITSVEILEHVYVNINMYRVLLKVDKVCLRIKQSVDLYIQIRKNQKHFIHCKKQTLVNGEITLTNTSEFFICSQQLCFSVEIYLVSGPIKKRGGVVEINLNNFEMNASNRIRAPIQHIPIQNCALYLDFVYMLSNKIYEGNELLSLQEIQNINHKQYLESISKQNQNLLHQKNRLNGEIEQLKQRNESLQVQFNVLEKNFTQRRQQCENQIEGMEVQRDSSYETLEIQKKKIAEIVDLINESRNYELISEAEAIINSKNGQSSFK